MTVQAAVATTALVEPLDFVGGCNVAGTLVGIRGEVGVSEGWLKGEGGGELDGVENAGLVL